MIIEKATDGRLFNLRKIRLPLRFPFLIQLFVSEIERSVNRYRNKIDYVKRKAEPEEKAGAFKRGRGKIYYFSRNTEGVADEQANPIFSINAGTKKSAVSNETAKLMITTAAKSCRFKRISSARKKTITKAPIVVKVAARIERKASLF